MARAAARAVKELVDAVCDSQAALGDTDASNLRDRVEALPDLLHRAMISSPRAETVAALDRWGGVPALCCSLAALLTSLYDPSLVIHCLFP